MIKGGYNYSKSKKSFILFINGFVKAGLTLFILFFSSLLFPDTYYGDEIKFEHITAADGLSQNTIFCIIQDRQGFMWFGTQHGLNRYDGHNFKLYENDPRKPGSVSDNLVISLYEDRSGFLWVGTWGSGLNRYDPGTEKFVVYKHEPGNINSLSNNNIWSIYEDKDGSGILWVGTEKGLNKFDQKSGEFKHYLEKSAIESKNTDESKDNRINVIFQDSSGVLWIGADDGLHEYNRENDKFTFHSHQNTVNAIYEDNAGSLWIGTEGGLYKFSLEERTFIPENIDGIDKSGDIRISSFCEDRSGILWIGTMGDGLYRFNIREKSFTHNKYDPNNPDSLNHAEIRAIYEDREGITNKGPASILKEGEIDD